LAEHRLNQAVQSPPHWMIERKKEMSAEAITTQITPAPPPDHLLQHVN
jgi:hypothetical protein